MDEKFEEWWEKRGKDYVYPKSAVYCGFRWGWIIDQNAAAEQITAPDAARQIAVMLVLSSMVMSTAPLARIGRRAGELSR